MEQGALEILYLTTESPLPATSGGRVRSLAQLELMASLPEVASITVLSLFESDSDAGSVEALGRRIPKVKAERPVFHPIHLRAHPRYVPRVLFERSLGKPYLAGKWASDRVARKLVEMSSKSFDVTYIDHLGMTYYADLLRDLHPRARLILEQHNVESDFFAQFADRKGGVVRLVGKAEHRLAESFERAQVLAADHVVAISEADAERFRAMGSKTTTLVPQCATRKAGEVFAPAQGCALYVGNLGWHPNVAGLDWFFAHVWPEIRAARPDLTLRICGSGLAKDADGKTIVPKAWCLPGVEVVGFVEDLAAEYEKAAVLVAPVRSGSGVRVKILEGMSYGVPIVTTEDGARGLPLTSGRELFIASDAHAFASDVVRVAYDTELGAQLREGAFRYLEAEHSVGVAQRRMREVLVGAGGLPATVSPYRRMRVDDICFDDVTTEEATAHIVKLAQLRDRPRYVCTGNLDHLAIAAADPEFHDVYKKADFVVADGAPVVWLSRLAGDALKERVAGSDLFWTLGAESARVGVTLFFLGGAPGAAEAAKAVLEARFPGVKVVGTYAPPFETFGTEEEQARIVERVRAKSPDILLVAFGAPKQEKWIAAKRERLGVPVSIGVGGSFEMASGMLKRAPVWMQRSGLEWAYRFSQEPKRLFERYIQRDLPHLLKSTVRAGVKRSARTARPPR